ncbi:PAS domain S-box protein [Roseomonas nepalensis]|uniref:histidine kinase n=1 Tax=Muricoccus nepalensis TaxID=1854500 RepID=A0A502FWN7_9PROT|nr:PAS domain S-box protein [Roseomonas nepalensis]
MLRTGGVRRAADGADGPAAGARSPGVRRARVPRVRLASLLFLLVLAVLVPALSLGALASWHAVKGQRAAAEGRLSDTARALALALDRELAGQAAALVSFAASPAFGPDPAAGNFAELDRHARNIAQRMNLPMFVAERGGRMILNTRLPRGAPLPSTGAPEMVEQVFATTRPAVSNLMIGAISGMKLVSVAAPVTDATGRVVLAVGGALPSERLRDLLIAQRLPAGTFATVSDALNLVVARSDDQHDATVGQPLGAEGVRAMEGHGEGIYRAPSADGALRVLAFHKLSAAPGWTVSVAQPAAAFDAAWQAPLVTLAVGGTAALLLSGVLALLAARGILVPVGRLNRYAAALARGDATGSAATIPEAGIAELETLRRGFAEAESALAARETEFRSLVQASPIGIIRSDLAGGVHAANDAFLQMVSLTRGELEGGRIRWDEITRKEDMPADERAIAEALADPAGQCRPYEKEYLRPDGTRVPVLLSFVILDRARGETACFVVDLTEVRRGEAALGESEARLRLAQEAGGVGVWERDLATGERRWSPGTFKLWGVPPEEVAADGRQSFDTIMDRVHPEDRERLAAHAEAGSGIVGPLPGIEFRVGTGEEARWIASAGEGVAGPDGRPVLQRGVMRDVTARRRAAVALSRQAERQALLLEASSIILEPHPRTDAALTERLFAMVAPHLGADICFNYAVEEEDAGLRLVAAPGLPGRFLEASRRLPFGGSFCGEVAAQGGPVTADAQRIAADPLGNFIRPIGITAYAGSPLIGADGRLIGTLSFASTRREAFEPEDVELLHTLAHLVALAWQRRRAEAALAASEAFGRSILAGTSDCIVVLDAEARIAFMNEAGRCQKEIDDLSTILGEPVDVLWPAESQAAVAAAIAEARAGRAGRYTAFGPTAKGAPKWWDVTVTPLPGTGEAAPRLLSVARDVTETRRAEIALRESETRFRAAVEAVSGIVWTNNAVGQMEGEQPAWAALTGQTRAEYEGYGWSRAVHPEDAQPTIDAWEAALAARSLFVFEHRVRCRDGAWRRFAVRAVPAFDPSGEIREWVGVHTDVTDQRAAEAVLARSRDELEALVQERTAALADSERRLAQAARMEALGRLAGGIAHDFNNVLQAVQGGVTLASRRLGHDPEAARSFLSLAADAAERGASVTGRLLAFSRHKELAAAPVDPLVLLSDMATMLRPTLGPSVTLRTVAPAAVPCAMADAGQLEAALVNLVTNARDALAGGQGTVVLAAESAAGGRAGLPPGGYVRLSVTDDGEGMTADVLARVTEPFFTTKPKGKGTGLGLAMARAFAEQSGGALTIESVRGRGTTVALLLPAAAERAAGAPAPAGTAVGRRRGALLRVLVVDDEADVRATLAASFADEGHLVAEAEDAAAALAHLDAGGAVDAIVTDLAMPGGLDGLALVHAARARLPGLPAVLVTGHTGDADPADVRRATEEGPFTLLRKPTSPAAIEAAMLALLGQAAHPGA